ncbi:MAG: hypothetical protein IJQ39_13355 [Thermoguttaceae bacterium]|nr:hypothetical protein [Thermoguttaceae bacterium]
MQIIGHGTETYLYLSGLSTSKEISLRDGIVLTPVSSEFHFENAENTLKLLKSEADFAVVMLSRRTIKSQLHIRASNGLQLAVMTLDALWDCILLGAILHYEIMGNIQCDKPFEELADATFFHVIDHHFRAVLSKPYQLTDDDEKWIGAHYAKAYKLMDNDAFRTAVHAMASYKWHTVQSVQLAILWSGIEALFRVSSEVSFRISLYIAKYLEEDNVEKAKELFASLKKLYNSRSSAVHGGKIKDDIGNQVSQSARLLNRIIRRCAELGSLPDTENLIFPNSYGTAES